MEKYIYMDNAATTRVKQEVLDEMLPYFTENYGNPSSIYALGSKSKNAVEIARERVAKAINANPKEIFFTAGGSEADNWAIKGVAFANRNKGNHIITSKIEHHAVLHTCEYLEKHGFRVTYLDVDEYGMVDLEQLEKSITDDTILISIMFANNEIGTIQPIKEIGQIAKSHGVYFHTDAVQAIGHVRIDVDELNIDLLSMAAHKFYGPKGVGALYIRKGVKIDSLIAGGGQERNRRAGTENVPGIVGMGKAIELAYEHLDESNAKLIKLRDKLISKVLDNIDHVRLNGHPTKRLPGNVNLCFEYIEGESMLLSLDMEGIAASSGSACTAGSIDPSHVLVAMFGTDSERIKASIRFSFGFGNTVEQVEKAAIETAKIVNRLTKK